MEGRACESAKAHGGITVLVYHANFDGKECSLKVSARAWPSVALGEDAVGDVAVDVGQAALNAVVVEGQLFVIDAHQV